MKSPLEIRFFKETGCNVEVLFQAGRIHLYQNFLQQVEKSNKLFAKVARPFFPEGKEIIELSNSRDYSVSSFLDQRVISVIGKDCESFTLQEIPLAEEKNLSGHFLSNGCYEETGEMLAQFLRQGSFTVGVCANKRSSYFKNLKKQYQMLYYQLLKRRKDVAEEMKADGDYRVYMIRGGGR